MNTVENTIKYIKSELSALYPESEISAFIRILFSEYLQFDTVKLIREAQSPMQADVYEKFRESLERLKNHEPVQYIVGNTYFFGLQFIVTPSVLIPRPETEELVDLIIRRFATSDKPLRILDIGTGSGCIAVSLAKFAAHSEVFALDISQEALKVARFNSENNATNICFFEDDILNPQSEIKNMEFDIIVSNPPYVTLSEKKMMQPNVLNHEPHTALFVSDDAPLLFYEHIAHFAAAHLLPGGHLVFEINEHFGEELADLMKQEPCFESVNLLKDMSGKNRFLFVTKNLSSI